VTNKKLADTGYGAVVPAADKTQETWLMACWLAGLARLGLLFCTAAQCTKARRLASALHCATRFMGGYVWLIPGTWSVTRIVCRREGGKRGEILLSASDGLLPET
jgi:hypothetical protein